MEKERPKDDSANGTSLASTLPEPLTPWSGHDGAATVLALTHD